MTKDYSARIPVQRSRSSSTLRPMYDNDDRTRKVSHSGRSIDYTDLKSESHALLLNNQEADKRTANCDNYSSHNSNKSVTRTRSCSVDHIDCCSPATTSNDVSPRCTNEAGNRVHNDTNQESIVKPPLASNQTDDVKSIKQISESLMNCQQPKVDDSTPLMRSNYTIQRGKRNYRKTDTKSSDSVQRQGKIWENVKVQGSTSKSRRTSYTSDSLTQSHNFKDGAICVIEDGLSSCQVGGDSVIIPSEDVPSQSERLCSASNTTEQLPDVSDCAYNANTDNEILTKEDYRKWTNILFSSEIGEDVVHTSLDEVENKININVEAGKLETTEAFLADRHHCYQKVFELMEGASVELFGKLAANPNYAEVDGNIIPGDSLSCIKAGINISQPDVTKFKQVSGGMWEFKDNVDPSNVQTRDGTGGAICQDRNTGDLYVLSAGHVYQQKWGFDEGTAVTNCKLFRCGETSTHHIANRYVSFMGQDENKNAIDVAAVPLVTKYQKKEYIQSHFGHGLTPSGEHVEDDEDIELGVYTGPSEILQGRRVQKRGAMTGYTRGQIIKAGCSDVQIIVGGVKRRIGDNCFVIASDDENKFAIKGDSGALIVDDQQRKNGKNAYGIFFCTLNGCPQYKSPATGIPYKSVAVCVPLAQSLACLSRKANIDLQLYQSKNENNTSVQRRTKLLRSNGPKSKDFRKRHTWSTNEHKNYCNRSYSRTTVPNNENDGSWNIKNVDSVEKRRSKSWAGNFHVPTKQPKTHLQNEF